MISLRQPILLTLVGIFVLTNAISLSLVRQEAIVWAHLQPVVLWIVVTAIAAYLLQRYRPTHDTTLFTLYAFLTGWGLVLQDRLAPAFIGRHTLWFTVGTAVMVAIAILPDSLRPLRHYRYTLLLTGILLLGITLLLGVNPSGFGAALWLPIPFVNAYFQPSELLKLLIIFFFASYFADRGRALDVSHRSGWEGALPYIAPLLLMWGFCMLLLVWQQDLGAAAIFFVLFLAMLYIATGKRRYLLIGSFLLIAGGVIGYLAYDLVALRIDAWWNPWPDFDNRAFQIVQSLYALASGGIIGQGIGQGFPTFIPVVHSDFIFAAIGEEWGLLGTLATICAFALLAQRGFYIALTALNSFRLYVAVGITVLLSTQAFLIMGGVTKLLPLTGVTLPFLSYGGSSLLMACVMLGLLLYLSAQASTST